MVLWVVIPAAQDQVPFLGEPFGITIRLLYVLTIGSGNRQSSAFDKTGLNVNHQYGPTWHGLCANRNPGYQKY